MRPDLFLVARLASDALGADLEWLVDDGPPFAAVDPIDFLVGSDIALIFDLYKTAYSKLDPRLNVQMPAALLEYNRWVLVVGEDGGILAFACFKTTPWGVKLGLATTDGGEPGKEALKRLLLLGLNVEGVYAEVSNGLEVVLAGRVPEVSPGIAARVLGKPMTVQPDGRHYTRAIANVGVKSKIMVGRPLGPEGRL